MISHGILPILPPKFYKICISFVSTKKLNSNLKTSFFFTKCRDCKIENRDGQEKLRNGHGKVMEKYVVKSVGTLQCVFGLWGSGNK